MSPRLEGRGEGDGTMRVAERITVERRQRLVSEAEELAEIREGLEAPHPWISSKYFYDETGSLLFDDITSLEEYYQTGAERSILERYADEIVRIADTPELLELGSGTSTKTRVLLDAMQRAGQLEWYVPLEVSEEITRRVAEELIAEYPTLHVHALVGDFTSALPYVKPQGRRLVALLGGTIGNFPEDEAAALLTELAQHMAPGEYFLLGTDLIKDPSLIEAAYNDARGITAAFNRNILNVLNAKLNADFDVEGFEHRAFYSEEHHRIEMRLVALGDHLVTAKKLDAAYSFPRGSEIRTEISVKYDRELVTALLERVGFQLTNFYTDEADLFGLSLALRRA